MPRCRDLVGKLFGNYCGARLNSCEVCFIVFVIPLQKFIIQQFGLLLLLCSKVLAVKKPDTSAPLVQNEHDFLGLVGNIACLWHANITELVGYCVEHGQWLLVYEYMSTTAI